MQFDKYQICLVNVLFYYYLACVQIQCVSNKLPQISDTLCVCVCVCMCVCVIFDTVFGSNEGLKARGHICCKIKWLFGQTPLTQWWLLNKNVSTVCV